MKTKKCLVCKKEFNTYVGKVCSRDCYSKYRSLFYKGNKHSMWIDGRSSEKKICPICRKNFKANRKQKCCSPKCMGKYYTKNGSKSGINNGMYKGGRIERNGYVFILKPEHPNAYKRYVQEHHLKMEKKIGRYLKPNEIVHHINEIKNDNRIENLQLMTRNEHDRLHCIERKLTGNFLRRKIENGIYLKCSYCGKIEKRYFKRKNITCIDCQKKQQSIRAKKWELKNSRN